MFTEGRRLNGEGDWRIHLKGWGVFKHDNVVEALGWARAAEEFGFKCEVYHAGCEDAAE
jgi:hypothetical protein